MEEADLMAFTVFVAKYNVDLQKVGVRDSKIVNGVDLLMKTLLF